MISLIQKTIIITGKLYEIYRNATRPFMFFTKIPGMFLTLPIFGPNLLGFVVNSQSVYPSSQHASN